MTLDERLEANGIDAALKRGLRPPASETKALLAQAAEEITVLRHRNEIMSAKLEMVDLFATVLHTRPASQSVAMGEDIARKLRRHLEAL